MAEPSVPTVINQERGKRIRELFTSPIVTRFKITFVLIFVAFLVLYLFLSLLINKNPSTTNNHDSTTLAKSEQMLKLLERLLQALANIVLPTPLGVIGQAHSSNGTQKT